MPPYILAIDQGTTSSRAIIFQQDLTVVATAQEEFKQHFPHNGWVEHNPEDLWQTVLRTCRTVIAEAKINPGEIASIGITNQRETTLIWDRKTGEPVYPAIVWQDRRTAEMCRRLAIEGLGPIFQQKTGLLLDPYFSVTKIRWVLDQDRNLQRRAEQGELAFGTVDSFLLWRLTRGRSHATDATNAARTMLFDIHRHRWSTTLMAALNIPATMLPEVKDCAAEFGYTEAEWFGAEIPIRSMIGDQQAALVGQACFKPGMIKSTYGTGCFAVVNTGTTPVISQHRLLTTIGYRLDGQTTYALEGSIFMAGAVLQWLRDGLGILKHAKDSAEMAADIGYDQSEIMVPAFTGLGAPYWDPDARAAIFGMTRDTGPKQLVAAALRSVALQTQDLLMAVQQDGIAIQNMRVDGGMVNNPWFMQALADLTGVSTVVGQTSETTVQGVAMLAALQNGWFKDVNELATLWREAGSCQPQLPAAQRTLIVNRWQDAIAKVRTN